MVAFPELRVLSCLRLPDPGNGKHYMMLQAIKRVLSAGAQSQPSNEIKTSNKRFPEEVSVKIK